MKEEKFQSDDSGGNIDTQESATEDDPLIKAAKLLKRALNAYSNGDLEQVKILLAKAEEIPLNTDSSDELFLRTEVMYYLKSWLGFYGPNKYSQDEVTKSIKSLSSLLEAIIDPSDDGDICPWPWEDNFPVSPDYPAFNKDFTSYMDMRIACAQPVEELLESEDFGNCVMHPYAIYMYIHRKLKLLKKTNRKKYIKCLKRLAVVHPVISYIYHIESSDHAVAFIDLLKALRDKYGMGLKTPYAEVGSGPGNMTWWLMYEELIEKGPVTLVDMNSNFMAYAKRLMAIVEEENPGLHEFDFMKIDAGKLAKESGKKGVRYNSVFSSLTIQWTDKPAKIVKSIYESLNPGGIFVMIGEEPPDVTSTTPMQAAMASASKELYPDYPPGKSLLKIESYCAKAGFALEATERVPLGKVYNVEKLMGHIKRYVSFLLGLERYDERIRRSHDIINNHHFAIATVWRKPG